MRNFYFDFQIDGKPILVPDEGVEISLADLDAEDSGRDESGFMHRVVLRKGVKTFGLTYKSLSREEYLYMCSLIMSDSGSFQVKYLDLSGQMVSATAYCSKHSISLYNARTGLYKSLKFNIIEC